MAKQTGPIKLQGTFGGLTHVKSKAYGEHTRAPRGTHTPVRINSSLKKEGKMLQLANIPAKIFKDAIDPYRKGISGGTFWQRLVSFFRLQLKTDGKFDFTKLSPFEIREGYPMKPFFLLESTIKVDKKKSRLLIEICNDEHPTFKKVRDADGYLFTIIGVFPDLAKKKARTSDVKAPVRNFKDEITPVSLELNVPASAKEYVVCLKLESCQRGVVNDMRTATALWVIGAGKI